MSTPSSCGDMWPFGDLGHGQFKAIVADPPWRYLTWSETRQTRAAKNHYAVMDLDGIKALPVADLAARDCCLFLWVVKPMLPHGLDVMRAWGLSYATVAFTWAKTTRNSQPSWLPKWHMGMGHWTRGNPEQCLLGTRGKPKRISKGVREFIVAPVREHSRKPDELLSSVERLVAGPYLEMFSRTNRAGWVSWGDQTGKFDPQPEIAIA